MYYNSRNNEEGSKSPLTPRAQPSIHNLSQAYPGLKIRLKKRAKFKAISRTCQRCWRPFFSAVALCDACPSLVCTFCLIRSLPLYSTPYPPIPKRSFMLAQIPARGVRVNRVYHCRTCGSTARLCCKALYSLA